MENKEQVAQENIEQKTKKPRAVKKQKEKKTAIPQRVILSNPSVRKEVREVSGEFGTFECSNYLSYEEKTALAIMITERSLILDESLGRGYVAMDSDAEMALGLLQGYTNIATPEDGRFDFYSYVVASGLYGAVENIIYPDAVMVKNMAYALIDSAIKRFDHTHSIDYYIKEMASGSQAGEELLSLINASSKQQGDTAAKITQEIDNLKASTANPLIDFSKRKK